MHKVWKMCLRYEKCAQGIQLPHTGMKCLFKVWNTCFLEKQCFFIPLWVCFIPFWVWKYRLFFPDVDESACAAPKGLMHGVRTHIIIWDMCQNTYHHMTCIYDACVRQSLLREELLRGTLGSIEELAPWAWKTSPCSSPAPVVPSATKGQKSQRKASNRVHTALWCAHA